MLISNNFNTSSNYREIIDKSSIDIDYKPLADKGLLDKFYSKNLLSKAFQDVNYSNTLISTDLSYIQEKNKKIVERKLINDFLCTRQISQNPYPIRILLS